MKPFPWMCLILLTGMIACHKSAQKPAPFPGYPGIDSISLDYCSGVVSIYGQHFDSIPVEDTILLNSLVFFPLTASSTLLTVQLPAAGYDGELFIHCNGLVAAWRDNIVWEKPVVDSISPSSAGTGTLVTIYGQYLNPNATQDSVYFNQTAAPIVATGPGYIRTVVPPGQTTGPVTVHTFCRVVTAPNSFVTSNKGVVYLCTNSDTLYALDAASGGRRWAFPVDGAGIAYANGVIYTGSVFDSSLYAIRATDGRQLWKISVGAAFGPPAMSGDTLYVAGVYGNVFAIDTTGKKLWTFNTGHNCTSFPLVSKGIVYECNEGFTTYALDAATGGLIWKRNVAGGAFSPGNGTLFMAGGDSTGEAAVDYAFDPATGNIHWSWSPGAGQTGGPGAYFNGMYIVTVRDRPVRALDAGTGNLVWTSTGTYSAGGLMEVSNNILYFTSSSVVVAMDPQSGALLWLGALDPLGSPQSMPTVANGVVYIGSSEGGVYAFDGVTGRTVWKTNAGPYPILPPPVVVDSAGNVFYAGNMVNQP